MATYKTLTYDNRKLLQELWEKGIRADEIMAELEVARTTFYTELRRGADGTRLENARLRYDAKLAQARLQRSYEARGRERGREVRPLIFTKESEERQCFSSMRPW